MESTPPMLSNPPSDSSAGSSDGASISTSSKSRIALAYSTRLRRWITGRPGRGDAAAAVRSISASSAAANA